METWIEATGPVIKTIGTESFSQSLSALLQQITPYDYTVIFGYHGADRPMDLFDDFPRQKRKVFVEDYQEGPYLLDPFYLACEQQVSSGLYRIRDLAPDRFFQGEYFRSYYIRTGLAEEVGYFITLPDDAIVVVSLMREKKAFSAKEIRQLRAFLAHRTGILPAPLGRAGCPFWRRRTGDCEHASAAKRATRVSQYRRGHPDPEGTPGGRIYPQRAFGRCSRAVAGNFSGHRAYSSPERLCKAAHQLSGGIVLKIH